MSILDGTLGLVFWLVIVMVVWFCWMNDIRNEQNKLKRKWDREDEELMNRTALHTFGNPIKKRALEEILKEYKSNVINGVLEIPKNTCYSEVEGEKLLMIPYACSDTIYDENYIFIKFLNDNQGVLLKLQYIDEFYCKISNFRSALQQSHPNGFKGEYVFNIEFVKK